ncbi:MULTISPECIES: DUF2306 domain-containing protein [unclassified Ruegeria]|uniref:DUF2306 domain-containing protein n=1 Tax=unclassified Ruegeria TaxID=2625375 RepID=UPI001487F46E|nr:MULTISPECIES: DUF2306 domain-containing protein [unclassified Ruegeria]
MDHQLVSPNYAFYLHVIFAPLALALAPFQLSESFRTKSLRRHRLLGRIYVGAVLLAGLSGIVIGLNAAYGIIAQSGFIALAIVWILVTVKAVRFAMQREIDRHRRYMIRSIALTFAAVTLRVWLPAQLVFGVPFDVAYQVVAWFCWLPNLIIAEYFVRKLKSANSSH